MNNIKFREKEEFDSEMICPRCIELGLKSLLYSAWSTSITQFCSFWDENGKYHSHYPVYTYYYRCSKDHLSEKVMFVKHNDSIHIQLCGTCNENRYVHDRDGEDGWTQTDADKFILEYIRDLTKDEMDRTHDDWYDKMIYVIQSPVNINNG